MRVMNQLTISICRDALEIIDSVLTILNHSASIHEIEFENSPQEPTSTSRKQHAGREINPARASRWPHPCQDRDCYHQLVKERKD